MFRRRRPRYLPDRGTPYGRGGPRYRRGRAGSGIGAGAVILGVVLLIGLGLLLWWFLSQGDDYGTVSQATGATTTVTTTDGQDVLAATAESGALAALENQTVSGNDAEVVAVAGERGFWAGAGGEEHVFVLMTDEVASTEDVAPGDTLDFSGILRVLPADYQSRFGIDDQQGAARLLEQGYFIEALSVTETTTD